LAPTGVRALNVSIGRPRQTQMVPERAASVLGAKQSATLQDRHDLINEIIEGAGKPGRHEVESVSLRHRTASSP
jgi:hypothetical protein